MKTPGKAFDWKMALVQALVVELYIPRTCLTLVLIVKELILIGLKLKRRVKTVLGSYPQDISRFPSAF